MKERPILFSSPMVRAILEGRKTQTRRVITLQNTSIDGRGHRMPYKGALWSDFDFGRAWADMGPSPAGNSGPYLHVPLAGQDETVHRLYSDFFPGDRLWVRETHYVERAGHDGETGYILYQASEPDMIVSRWRPSIHMPRWASRILLEVTDVRVERVQDISAEDAMSEGMRPGFNTPKNISGRELFYATWDSINLKRGYGWDANPWVWVVQFKRLEP